MNKNITKNYKKFYTSLYLLHIKVIKMKANKIKLFCVTTVLLFVLTGFSSMTVAHNAEDVYTESGEAIRIYTGTMNYNNRYIIFYRICDNSAFIKVWHDGAPSTYIGSWKFNLDNIDISSVDDDEIRGFYFLNIVLNYLFGPIYDSSIVYLNE